MQVISFIGATFCFIVSAAAIKDNSNSSVEAVDDSNNGSVTIDDDGQKQVWRFPWNWNDPLLQREPVTVFNTHLKAFADVYHEFFNLDMAKVLVDDTRHRFIWDNLSLSLLPFGELVRSMPDLARRMSRADEQNRSFSLQLGTVLNSYHPHLVSHICRRTVCKEYDNKILWPLHETFASLVTETQLIRHTAGIFAATCSRNHIVEFISKLDRIFRQNCLINCLPTHDRFRSNCILETLGSDHEYVKQNITAHVQRYERDLMLLMITAIFCEYSHAEDFSGDCDLNCRVSRHTAQIMRIADYIIEFANFKMGEAWPNVSSNIVNIVFGEYVRQNSDAHISDEGYYILPNMIQERLNEIGDYKHNYQVLVVSAKTLTVVSTNMPNILFLTDKFGIDCLVVRHRVGHFIDQRAQTVHRNMKYELRSSAFQKFMENCKFRPENIAADLKEFGKAVNLTLPSQQTYGTVAIQHAGSKKLFYGAAFTNHENFLSVTYPNETDNCRSYRLFVLL